MPIKRDKIFAFSGFQATCTRTAPPQTISYVATQQALNGDFSALESAACQSSKKTVTLIDPSNNQPFPNNQISPSRFNAPSVALQKFIPIATDPCGQITYSTPNPNNENQYIGKVDWVQSAKDTITARYFVSDYDNPPYYTNNILTTTRSGLEDRVQTVTLGEQYTIGPTLVNAVHATFNRLAINRAAPANMPSPVSVGVNMYNNDPHYIDLSVTNHFTMGGGSNAPAYFMRNQYHFTDDFDMVRGRHHFSYGVSIITIGRGPSTDLCPMIPWRTICSAATIL